MLPERVVQFRVRKPYEIIENTGEDVLRFANGKLRVSSFPRLEYWKETESNAPVLESRSAAALRSAVATESPI
jgi:hypothetical protein